jgi:hypothetical protein
MDAPPNRRGPVTGGATCGLAELAAYGSTKARRVLDDLQTVALQASWDRGGIRPGDSEQELPLLPVYPSCP